MAETGNLYSLKKMDLLDVPEEKRKRYKCLANSRNDLYLFLNYSHDGKKAHVMSMKQSPVLDSSSIRADTSDGSSLFVFKHSYPDTIDMEFLDDLNLFVLNHTFVIDSLTEDFQERKDAQELKKKEKESKRKNNLKRRASAKRIKAEKRAQFDELAYKYEIASMNNDKARMQEIVDELGFAPIRGNYKGGQSCTSNGTAESYYRPLNGGGFSPK